MPPDLPKLQHYVPQFLLRQWGTGKTYLVHVFDKRTGRTFAAPSNKSGAERGFYNLPDSVTRERIARFREERGADALPPQFEDGVVISAEGSLGNIENRAATVIQRIVETESLAGLSDPDRAWLAGFTALQFLRTPYIRDMYAALVLGARAVIAPLLDHPGNDAAGGLEQLLAGAGLPDPTPDHLAEAHLQHLAHGVEELLPYFLHKHWMLERAPQVGDLYIGDNPVTQANNALGTGTLAGGLGLALPHSEVAFPLRASFIT